MANDITIPATGTGTATPNVATDDVGGRHFQRVKLDIGAAGATTPVTAAAPLPVVQTGTPALPTGAATEATLDTRTGALTETAPASDTASSGINGRLQRIAQRLTSLIAVFNIGAGTEAAAVRVTLPTDGTGKVNAAQSGTWTVQPGNTANTTAWKVDGSAVTQPVSNATLPLPTGASTAAKQPALGTAGTASADVISVQGVASMTPVTVGGKSAVVPATLTRPSDTTAYAAGDSASSSTSAPVVLTFSNCARVSGGSGTIVRALMTDSAYSATPGSFELWLLDTTTTPTNDNAAFAPSDADANAVVAIVPFSAVYSGTATAGAGGNMVYQAVGPWPFVCVGSANLFGIIVVRNAYTPISAEAFQIRLFVAQD